jgi:hypothetical protein
MMTVVCISMTSITMFPAKVRSVREWFVNNKVPEKDWPAQNTDLNPTEHLWVDLECPLCSRPQSLTSITALATPVKEEWAAILPETFTRGRMSPR